MGLAIVAIPEQGDRTYKISSEKVPHCTLLFLGDAESANTLQIQAFLEHAIEFSDLGPFGLEVERRGKLGADDADVLFFHKRWSGKRLEQFRGQLLQNRFIKDAYNSTEQFEGWTPHLTLGYPRAPARKNDRDYPIGYVQFDKIALWSGDYSGPEFELTQNYNEEIGELAMSQQADRGREFLEHYGVKGMRWGQSNRQPTAAGDTARALTLGPLAPKSFVRTAQRATGKKPTTDAQFKKNSQVRKAARSEKKSDKQHVAKAFKASTMRDIQKKAGNEPQKVLDSINKKPEYAKAAKDGTLLNPHHPTTAKYNHDVAIQYGRALDKAAKTMESPSGNVRLRVDSYLYNGSPAFKVNADYTAKGAKKYAKHADETAEFVVVLKLDAQGRIVGFEDAISTSMEQAEDFVHGLLHYGTKGMKWGVRKPRNDAARAKQFKNRGISGQKTKVKTEGGEGQDASNDAIKVAAKKATLKKSGPAALSNQDLQDVIQRSRLEREANDAISSSGKKFVKKTLGDQGKEQGKAVIREGGKKGFEKVKAARG